MFNIFYFFENAFSFLFRQELVRRNAKWGDIFFALVSVFLLGSVCRFQINNPIRHFISLGREGGGQDFEIYVVFAHFVCSSRVGTIQHKSLDFPPLSINIGMTIHNLYYSKRNWTLRSNSNFLISISLQSQGDCEPKCGTQDHVFCQFFKTEV